MLGRNLAFFVVFIYFVVVGTVLSQIKIHHDLTVIESAERLNWYIGTYLSLPRVFMSVVRRKIVQSPKVESVLIPLYTVRDPVSGRQISINITDRYFFIGSREELNSEEDLGVAQHTSTIMLLRNSDQSYKPSRITPQDIKNVIRTHIQRRRVTIQQDVTVCVTEGTFKDWFGTVEQKFEDREIIRVKFLSDEYEYSAEMPSVFCKVAT